MADRDEKLTVTRNTKGTTVKLEIVENGIKVDYSVKTHGSDLKNAVAYARDGAQRYLDQLKEV